MPEKPRFFEIIDLLIGRWCDRRELGALARLLPAYMAINGLTDGWVEVFHALRATRAWGAQSLPRDEMDMLGEAIALVHQSLAAAGTIVG